MTIAEWSEASSKEVSRPPAAEPARKSAFSCVDLATLGSSDHTTTVDLLEKVYRQSGSPILVVRISQPDHVQQVDQLVSRLYQLGVPVLLVSDHDLTGLDTLSLAFLAGIIIENALILRTGDRRDYFRAGPLRSVLSRAAREREERPEFFLGFLDRWDSRPHASIIRRAGKLAQHFGAVLEHGPLDPSSLGGQKCPLATTSVSGFEYLRRSETTEVSNLPRALWDLS